MLGIYEPTSGAARVLGKDPAGFDRETRAQIGYMLQDAALYHGWIVRDNLNFASFIYGVGLARRKQLDQVLEFVELREHRKKRARNLSGGMRRRLALAATLVHDPTLLFMDEPTGGVDPLLRHKLVAIGLALFLVALWLLGRATART